MNNLFSLRTCQTQKDFAKVLGYSEKEFTLILFSQSIQNKYQSFDIPKKNGNKRKILAPTPDLKILQTRLSTLLTNCYEELEKKDYLNLHTYSVLAHMVLEKNYY